MTSLALALRPTAAAMARSQISRALALLRSPKCVLWQDASDLSTLFQDSAGTTPVTAVEQPVGLVLDKRTAGQPGPELVTNGSNETALFNFGTIDSADTLARAAAPGGGFAASATSTTSTSTAHRFQELSALLQGGKTYRISGRYYVPTGGVATFRVFDNIDGSWFGVSSTTKDQWVAFSVIRTKATNWNLAIGDHVAGVVTSGQIAYWIDDLSITEIPGVHFIQATPASRPTLSSRYNLLTKTEQLDDAVWSSSVGVTRSANTTTAPDGAAVADSVIETAAAGVHYFRQTVTTTATGHTFSVYLKANGRTFGNLTLDGGSNTRWFNLSSGTTGGGGVGSSTIESVGNGWYRCAYTMTLGSTTANCFCFLSTDASTVSYAGDGTSGIFVWGASLTTAADASLPYQRVNTATDYDFDFSKFPPYLRYDGVDDFRASVSTVDLTGTDKITVVGAWHKTIDTAVGVLFETSADTSANAGAFCYLANGALVGTDAGVLGGTKKSFPTTAIAAPATSVLSLVGNIATDTATIRRNGVQVGTSAADQGTGNYGNFTMFAGSRGGVSFRFSGREYGFALFNTILTNAEIAAVEAYFRAKSRAY